MIKPLCYYYADGTHVIFNKYTIENGVIRNKKGEPMAYNKDKTVYNRCSVYDDNGKRRIILVGRAIASSMYGSPPTPAHTADHKDKNRENDTDDNIRWLCRSGQRDNQDRPEEYKTAFLVDRYGENEKTANEWTDYLNSRGEKNRLGREYNDEMIKDYARKKRHGFSYKEYPDLPGEVWKDIVGTNGKWKISDMNRVKQITNHAENVLSEERFCLRDGYPTISINGKKWPCHILSFATFFPEEYANKKTGDIVLHEDDEPLDFRPYKLRLGTHSDNRKDAYNNGKYDGTKTAMTKCASYVNGKFEKEHKSQHDAEKYLKSKGYTSDSQGNIGKALNPKYTSDFAYGRTWKRIIT
jgi:hypothetical protein